MSWQQEPKGVKVRERNWILTMLQGTSEREPKTKVQFRFGFPHQSEPCCLAKLKLPFWFSHQSKPCCWAKLKLPFWFSHQSKLTT